MTLALQSKSLVVIGGTSGLGLSAAKAFIAAGAQVVVVGKNPEKIEDAKKTLGHAAMALTADATDPKAAIAAVQVAVKNFGGFHALYHVAGGSGRRMGDGPLHEITDDGWRAPLDLDPPSPFKPTPAAGRRPGSAARRSPGAACGRWVPCGAGRRRQSSSRPTPTPRRRARSSAS